MRGSNATYIPSARVGSVGARVGSLGVCFCYMRVFGYQHVDICHAKVSRGVSRCSGI